MTLAIGFDAGSGNLVIWGNGVFCARSLTAVPSITLAGYIQISDIAGRGEQHVAWADITSLDGSYAPLSMADALAYLQGEFAKGQEPIIGPRGPGVFTAAGDPDPALGSTGDLYIDAVSGDLYQK